MKTLIILSLFIFAGCSNDDTEPTKTTNANYWKTRHDTIPETMIGEWVSVTDKAEIVLSVTDRFVMTKDFSVSHEQGNAVNVENRMYTVYQNGHVYTLAFGSGQYSGQVTITVDNDCYDTVVPFEPSLPDPEPSQPEPQEPVFN